GRFERSRGGLAGRDQASTATRFNLNQLATVAQPFHAQQRAYRARTTDRGNLKRGAWACRRVPRARAVSAVAKLCRQLPTGSSPEGGGGQVGSGFQPGRET